MPLRPEPDEEPGDPEAGHRQARAAAVEPLLVNTRQAAALCGIGRATWFRLKAMGKTPAPVMLAGRVLYRVEDLRLWVALGCPSRREFEARKAAGGRR
jgi:predicted DNA-binding transcriptional regulator AlpA